ncbi:MAG: TVP38/TMEM64 family protein [Firmicutes bacterium]|nr:TVP38/TMEM64 family protein [Bacillota bacterium]
MNKKITKTSIKILLIVLFVGIVYVLNKMNVFKGLSPEDIKAYLDSFGLLAPIVYIVMFTFIPLTLFPDSILAIAGGMGFGLIKGSILTMIGALLGGTLSFYITRLLGKDFIKRIIKKDISFIGEQLKQKGFFIILILRLVPLFPFDVISYSAGLSDIKYRDFISATIIGTIPGILVYTNLGDKSTQFGSMDFYISVFLLLALLLISMVLKKYISIDKVRRKLDNIES